MLLASEFVLSENTCWAKSWKHVCVLRFKQWTGMKMRQNINKVNGPWSEVRFFWQENRVEWWLDSTILRILNLQLLHNCARFSEIETFQIMLKKSWKQLKNTLIHDFDSAFYLLTVSALIMAHSMWDQFIHVSDFVCILCIKLLKNSEKSFCSFQIILILLC